MSRHAPEPCYGCERLVTRGAGTPLHPEMKKPLCTPCYKRLVWRPRGGEAVEHDRETSRSWKDRNRDQNRARDREYKRRKRQEAA